MKFRRTATTLLSALAILLIIALPVYAYLFSATVTVTETSGNAYTMIGVRDDLSATWLTSNGYMLASGLDTDITPDREHMVASDALYVATPLPASSQVNLTFTTGNAAAASMAIVPGYNGYVTANDVAAWELGSAGSIVWDGYVDTAAAMVDENILYKRGSFITWVSAASTVSASIIGTVTQGTTNTAVTLYAGSNIRAGERLTAFPAGIIREVSFWLLRGGNPPGTASVTVRKVSDDSLLGTLGTIVPATLTLASTKYTFSTTAVVNDADQDIRVQLEYNDGDVANYIAMASDNTNPYAGGSLTYYVAAYTDDAASDAQFEVVYSDDDYIVSVAGVSVGEHTITAAVTAAAGTTLTLTVDALAPDSAAGTGAVPDNANDWVLMSNATPYVNSYRHSVGGVLVGWYQPVSVILGRAYSTGTVTVTNGDATVTGAGGATWTDAMVGSVFLSADGLYYTIASRTNATEIELSTVYAGGTLGGQTYNFYPRLPDRNTNSRVADAGSTNIRIIDAVLTQANDFWNGARLTVITTTDGLAPQGESAIITDFIAASDELQFLALTAAVDAGDTYELRYDGAITFGANPAGVAVAIGSLVGYVPSVSSSVAETTEDRLPEVPVSDWYGDGTITKAATLANPLRSVALILSDNTTMTEIQSWRYMGGGMLIVLCAVIAKAVRRHQGITAIAAGAVIALLVAFDSAIFPLYLVVFAVMLIIGGLVAERSPTL